MVVGCGLLVGEPRGALLRLAYLVEECPLVIHIKRELTLPTGVIALFFLFLLSISSILEFVGFKSSLMCVSTPLFVKKREGCIEADHAVTLSCEIMDHHFVGGRSNLGCWGRFSILILDL